LTTSSSLAEVVLEQSVSYGSGSFSGNEYTDTVTFSSSLKISKQSIGVATTSSGFSDVDGILGVGPVDLTVGTLSEKSKSIPTVTDSLFANKAITSHTLGIFFQPTGSKASSVSQFMTFESVGHDIDFCLG
jgi:pepsin A